jgi:hypothetical protein
MRSNPTSVDPRPFILNFQLSTFNFQLSTPPSLLPLAAMFSQDLVALWVPLLLLVCILGAAAYFVQIKIR